MASSVDAMQTGRKLSLMYWRTSLSKHFIRIELIRCVNAFHALWFKLGLPEVLFSELVCALLKYLQ